MSKTILSKVDGWTPVIEMIVQDLGVMSSVVFGRMWRYCQMEDGVCKASLEKISQGIGIDRATVMRHAKDLCDAGYLKDLTPDLRNKPHIYADTGKASMRINITVAERNTFDETVAESNTTVAESHTKNSKLLQRVIPTVAESQLKKDSKKEEKEEREEESFIEAREEKYEPYADMLQMDKPHQRKLFYMWFDGKEPVMSEAGDKLTFYCADEKAQEFCTSRYKSTLERALRWKYPDPVEVEFVFETEEA